MPSRQPSWMLLIVTSWSYDRKLFSRSELFCRSLAIRGFSHLDENINPRVLVCDGKTSWRRFVRIQCGQLFLVSADQMPLQDELHRMTEWLGCIDIGRHQQPTRCQQIIKYVHQPFADPVRHIIEKSRAINKIIASRCQLRTGPRRLL